ncbi:MULTISPECIES: hypothetical protein [unclassified Bradyrhizobium]|uniref:hypothetical protein n=1 Tax=unclassified Bradyrhizobium TaxID=2631580 RepID=UPI0024793F68|nr:MULTISPECIES: hypothetical protein [unclassified Bradyrhizobium]WGR72033.1 hypothetical protein MTX24_03465 [Bradyrhizobium sp. ISRA426]WGR76867.1 hypothetical protein MTX21_28415 [Bradyrhizobium sp. ISRA430]WGR87272.1 hypothetical protein MTX25_03465 [Bradyrhizobium sp. ISRA432]
MTKRFAKRLALVATMMTLVTPAVAAQPGDEAPPPPPKPGKPINTGDVLSGELNAMRVRDVKNGGKRVATYLITSEPRRLPPPSGLCNLETGPETFQLVTSSDAQATQLKSLVGKEISVKVDEIACASDAGQMSEAVITKWSLIKKQ